MPYKGWHAKMTVSISSGIFFDAYDVNIMTSSLLALSAMWGIEGMWYGMLGSAGFLGMFFGAIFGGFLADKLGRAKTFCLYTAVYSIAMGLAATSGDFADLFVWRVISGLGLGGLVPVAVSYLAEFVPAKYRGRSMSLMNAIFGVGTALAFFLGYAIVMNMSFGANGWKYGFLIGAIPIVIAVIGWFFFPESVRWLVEKGQYRKAAEAVDNLERKLTGSASVSVEDAVRIEEEQAKARVKPPKVPLAEIFKKDTLSTTLLMSAFYWLLAYATYGFTIWLPKLLQGMLVAQAGAGANPAEIGRSIFLWLAISTFVAAIIAPVTGFLADGIGRKKTVLISFFFFAIAVALLGNFGATSAMIVLIFLMAISLNMCNAILYVYVPENFPTAMRASGVGFSSAIGRVGGFLGPIIIAAIGNGMSELAQFYSVSIALILAAILIAIFGKETKAASLENIAHKSA
jgi:putative MFS transporter